MIPTAQPVQKYISESRLILTMFPATNNSNPSNKINQLGHWLSTFTYENLTKLDRGEPRDAGLVLSEQQEIGAGGTCFSIVNLADKKAREQGLEPRFYLGERPDGEARHCVIGFPREGLFLDPGYLCFNPLPLHPETDSHFVRPHNTLHLERVDSHHLKISTERQGQKTWRHTLTTQPVARQTFEQAWTESFGWKSVMNSRVLTRLRDKDMIIYLNGRLESIRRDQRERLEVPDHRRDTEYLSELFDVQESLLKEWDLTIDH